MQNVLLGKEEILEWKISSFLMIWKMVIVNPSIAMIFQYNDKNFVLDFSIHNICTVTFCAGKWVIYRNEHLAQPFRIQFLLAFNLGQ